MKSVPKLIRRFVGILLLSSILIVVFNFIALAIITAYQSPNGSPWITADETAEALQSIEQGYVLSDEMTTELHKENTWAIYIDNATGKSVWHSDNLPESIPLEFTASDIANLTRGYIDGYPTFTGEAEDGLIILGYPKDSYWKHMWPSWDYRFIENLPQTILAVLAANVLLIFIIYMVVNTKLLKSIKPIADGIQALPTEQPVCLKEKGVLSELYIKINRTSEILQSQNYQLRKKETARANWIAGVSHDIRTPLSMVMGYAGQLESDTHLSDEERKKATVILRQSERMKNLINDLNLASKLEYNMQPIKPKQENMVAIARQVVVDFIDIGIGDKYHIKWLTDNSLNTCIVNANKDLIKRAIGNLIQNSINHNKNGCKIFVSVTADNNRCCISVADDGIGATDEQIEKLNNSPHYMVCDENTSEQRHGLGLLIVKQIISSHNGETIIEQSQYGGFEVKLILPL
ncbi:HAMP domain-containing histidine kinase [Clostridium sp. D2Q-14]|uniref:sensor histidine kinase n=1 Tax=Anaeromonas gelatinilytica TaxID=2683194 RepID=UPI00193C0F50|nr:HAMP domain-containing sensor histidine kinase [Anaeromonas gelatinilytica]MBS4536762.1 HAMP domain-containing histidine kinase [Anaeromonas gelatinilytica]